MRSKVPNFKKGKTKVCLPQKTPKNEAVTFHKGEQELLKIAFCLYKFMD